MLNFVHTTTKDMKRMEEEKRCCPNCNRPFTGRSDKKFCSDSCRTMFNNRIKRACRTQHGELSRIDRILKKNHAIIERLYSRGERETTFTELFGMGFNFEYQTSMRENPDTGSSYIIGCYDYTYVISRDGRVRFGKRSVIPL